MEKEINSSKAGLPLRVKLETAFEWENAKVCSICIYLYITHPRIQLHIY